MDPNFTHQHGDGQEYPPDVQNFLNEKCHKYMKLKKRLRKLMPSRRICRLSIPKHCNCPPNLKTKFNFRPHIQIIRLDIRARTRLEQLAYPRVRKLIETRDVYRHLFHPKRYFHINKMIRRSLFSQYSRLANAQAPKKPIRPVPWTRKEWRQHLRILKKLARPKPVYLPPKIVNKKVPLEELIKRIKKLAKPKKLFLPPAGPRQKTLMDLKRTYELAKPKPYDPSLYIKPKPPPIDRNEKVKVSKRIRGLAEPKNRSASESDMKENPFQVSPNALKFKCRAGSRLANLAKPKEYEDPPINPNAYSVSKNALKAKASKRTIELAEPKKH